jgi:hypothetical protein
MNTFKRFALGAVLALACSIACAATLTLSTEVLEHGTLAAKGSVTYYGLADDELNLTLKETSAIPTACEKVKDKGGAYTVRLVAVVEGAPVGFKAPAPVAYDGMTFRGLTAACVPRRLSVLTWSTSPTKWKAMVTSGHGAVIEKPRSASTRRTQTRGLRPPS